MKKTFVILSAIATVAGAHAQSVVPTLGAAEFYSVLGLGNTAMTMSSGNTVVTGNVGVGPNSKLDFSGGGHINGFLDVDPTSSANISGGSQASLGQRSINLAQATQDAISASMTAQNDAATMTLSSLGNNSMINATGALSVIDVTGDVGLSGGGKLTINAAANQFVVVNVNGAFTFSGGSQMVLTGGITANHLLWNFVGSGKDINFNGNSTLDGTFLAVDRNITVSGGVVNGAVIGSRNGQLKLQSGPKINGQPVPEPISMLLLAPGLFMLRRRKNRS